MKSWDELKRKGSAHYKTCTRCGETKLIDLFPPHKERKDGHGSHCKKCMAEHSRRYYHSHKKTCQQRHSEWTKHNAEHVLLYNQIYRKTNGSKVKRWDKTHYINRNADPKYRVNHMMASVIGKQLKGNKKGRTWESLVDYTFSDLRKHLEKQFSKGMSWDNYGRNGWHVDHKIPINAFHFTSEKDIDFKKCWALSNLQPMWAIQNVKKGCKLFKPFQPSLKLEVA